MKHGNSKKGQYTRPVSHKTKKKFGAVRESKGIRWQSEPMDKMDSMLRSADRRWTIIQGQDHFTLLDHGAAVFRCSSQDGAIQEAARIAGQT